MFTDYFLNRSKELSAALNSGLEKRGLKLPGKEKDLNLFKEFYTFLREHLPEHFSLATGKVRNKKHILNRNCDLLLYKKWCPKFMEMAGGYIIADTLYAFMSLEAELTTSSLVTHAALTNALKSLYAVSMDGDGEETRLPGQDEDYRIIPMFSILVAYKSSVPLLSHKLAIKDTSREKGIASNHELDMICILDQGLIIKDWESGGEYKAVETGADTLMWFFILLLEFLDRDNILDVNLRNFIKSTKDYKEY